MGDEVLDAVVDRAADDAAIEEFCMVGAEANDTRRAGARHSRHIQELVDGRGVDIDGIFLSVEASDCAGGFWDCSATPVLTGGKTSAISVSAPMNRRMNFTGSFSSLVTIS